MEERNEETALTRAEPAAIAIFESLPVEAILQRTEKVHEIARRVMKKDVHYGVIPGTKKPSLLKPGAQVLCMTFMFKPGYFVLSSVLEPNRVHYEIKCVLTHIPTQLEVAEGVGSASSWEKKYRYRIAGRACPSCGNTESLLKSKRQPEWFCWTKKGGCGATFALDDPAITEQQSGRVENPDQHDVGNTIFKMAAKRALIDATITATGCADIYTQDVEDMGREHFESSYSESERQPEPEPEQPRESAPPPRRQQPRSPKRKPAPAQMPNGFPAPRSR